MLEKEFQYYLAHQKELIEKYNGRVIVIKDEKVIGDYKTEIEAYNESIKNHKIGTFLIQLCIPGDDVYTQTFHSRVIFA